MVALVLAVAACGGSSSADDRASADSPGGTASKPLRVVNSFAATAVDPALPGSQWCRAFGACEHPMVPAENGGHLEPWLLESLDRVDDLTWTLTLRDGISFQNGTPLDGEALAAALQRQLDESSSVAAVLPGGRAEVSGELEATLVTDVPTASVPWLLAEQSLFPIYDVAALEAHFDAGGDDLGLANEGIFTGPFEYVELTSERMVLTRFDDYWGGEPVLPGLEVRFVTDDQARLLAVQNGEADLALYPPAAVLDTIEGRTDVMLRRQAKAQETLRLSPNVGRAPLDEADVRRAIAFALDYEEIATGYTSGLYDPAVGMYPLTVDFAIANQRTDVDEAGRLLDAAGWTLGSDGVRRRDGTALEVVLLTYPQQPDTSDVAIGVQHQLREIGIRVQIRQVDDINAAIDDPSQWDLALIFNSTLGLSGDPINPMRRYLHSESGDNQGRYGVDDPELDGIIEELERTFDVDERDALLRRAQELVIEEQGYLIIAGLKPFPVLVGPEWSDFEVSSSRRLITAETSP